MLGGLSLAAQSATNRYLLFRLGRIFTSARRQVHGSAFPGSKIETSQFPSASPESAKWMATCETPAQPGFRRSASVTIRSRSTREISQETKVTLLANAVGALHPVFSCDANVRVSARFQHDPRGAAVAGGLPRQSFGVG
jgi:hypothetical protein